MNVIFLEPMKRRTFALRRDAKKKTVRAPVSYTDTSYDLRARIKAKKGYTKVTSVKPTVTAKKARSARRFKKAVKGT